MENNNPNMSQKNNEIYELQGENQIKKANCQTNNPTSVDVKKTKRRKLIFKQIKRVFCIVVLIFVSVNVIDSFFKRTYGVAYMESELSKKYNDVFEYTGPGDSVWSHSTISYTFKAEKLPDEKIRLLVNKRYLFLDHKKWSDDYLSIKYLEESENEIKKLLYPVYGDIQIKILPGVVSAEHNKGDMSFDEYIKRCLRNSSVTLIVTSSMETKEKDANEVVEILKNNDILLNIIKIYYVEEPIEDALIERNNISSSSIGSGYIFIHNDLNLDEIRWSE